MKNISFINYQGSKRNIIEFIVDAVDSLNLNDGKILDIFSGSSAVTSALLSKYDVVSNDVELYATVLSKAISNTHKLSGFKVEKFLESVDGFYHEIVESECLATIINKERFYIENKDLKCIIALYQDFETVWNTPNKFNPDAMRKENKYNLFVRYYGGSYFGIKQAVEIDAITKAIHHESDEVQTILLACLFYAMKETAYSRDGHMAQPLKFQTSAARGFNTRVKSVQFFFERKINEILASIQDNSTKNHMVYNEPLDVLLLNEYLIKSVDVIYADPPYTDMQYSRYYHLLNIVAKYDFPKLSKTKKGFTTGLYTEGRFQSPLSQKSGAKKQLLNLVQISKKYEKTLILSYAYPKNSEIQQTTRYTISIKELIDMCHECYGTKNVEVRERDYAHANHRNSHSKPVVEYLIICKGLKQGIGSKSNVDIAKINKKISTLQPTNKSPIYNTHLYWSQKAYNITDYLIKALTNKGDVVFDPFLGSGVTVLESVREGIDRMAVGCDINEMPLFIAKTLLSDSMDKKAIKELQDLSIRIDDIQYLYHVVCSKCKSSCLIDKVIFDKPVRNINDVKINQVNINCTCGNRVIIDENIFDHIRDNMYANYEFKYIQPNFQLLKNSKAAVLENDTIGNIFTNRNLKALDMLLDLSQNYSENGQNLVKYIINSMLHQCKITDLRSNSQWLLWIPKKDCVEKNVFTLMKNKIKKFLTAQKTIRAYYTNSGLVSKFSDLKQNKALLLHKGSQNIEDSEIPNDSVDLIITDPPYLEQVLYSEYMQLYKPIVGLDYNLEDEIVVSSAKDRNKTKDLYYKSLEEVFLMCGKKLKHNKILCLYFHDSDLAVWDKLIDMLYRSGFEFMSQTHIKKNMTLKNIISPKKSLNGDSILFFNNAKNPFSVLQGQESIQIIETEIAKEAYHMLSTRGALSTPELYDLGLMTVLIQNGWLKTLSQNYKSLVDIFEKYLSWDAKIAKWVVPTGKSEGSNKSDRYPK